MGSATQKYSLKWNDFTVNVASTFRDLHSRHDFVDVTLACSDGSTLEAHKVILSSVSTYFRDILKTTPCKHPIIILKDTGRDEAAAMLEFAYTGEVNVAQELLPCLLQTARAFRIKGLDKVESPVEPPPAAHVQTPSTHQSRSHTPNSIQSQQDVKPFFLGASENSNPPAQINGRRDLSPPPSLPGSQPPTREASPCPQGSNSRTPPPKRWKRSFDLNQPVHTNNGIKDEDQPMPMIPENYSSNSRSDYEASKNYNESSTNVRSMPYPHSMPTSPTMFERGNENRLAGLFRHHLSNSESNNRSGIAALINAAPAATVASSHAQPQQRPESTTQGNPQMQSTSTPITSPNGNGDYKPVDYRCFNSQSSNDQDSEVDYSIRNGRANSRAHDEEKYLRNFMVFRPESAPTVMDMSPENSLSEAPSSAAGRSTNLDLSKNCSRAADNSGNNYEDIAPDATGRYSCDECGKFFKHPGSLQHHRHIHRGTHRCPSCGKAFSRRWDMERHLNKSKYGCPANRFSSGSSSASSHSTNNSPATTSLNSNSNGATSISSGAASSATRLQLLTAAGNSHNTTA